MVSNLSTIGLAFADDVAFNASMTRLAAKAQRRVKTCAGDYAVWRSETGAEVWFHHRTGGGIAGLTPFFDGQSRMTVKVTERFKRPDDSPFEGALMAWMAPGDDGAGIYPLVFDAVDFAAISGRSLPCILEARIAGFAHQLRAFPSADAYDRSQTCEPKFAAQSFVPIGMFATAVAEGGGPPSSAALLAGRVGTHRRLTSDVTGQTFHWLLVESLGASFDIVADPEVVEGDIRDGATVEVCCWLFGRVLD
jgi:hypothetical protein